MFEAVRSSKMVPTNRFRWLERMGGQRVLQQAFAPECGGQIEWRLLPIVLASEADNPSHIPPADDTLSGEFTEGKSDA